MGEQTVGRVLPTEPGPWHVEVSGVAIVVNVRARSWRGELDGFAVWVGGEIEEYDVEDARFVWLAPVAPIGSVPPEVYVRDVREAFVSGVTAGLGGCDPDVAFRVDSVNADLLATLTAHGLTPDEAARVVAGVTP